MSSNIYKSEPAIGKSEKGQANGVATLDPNGLVPSSQLDIVNALDSTSTDKPLSAAQGKALNDSIATLNNNLSFVRNASSTNDVLVSALACTGTTVYRGAGSSYTGVLPENNFKWGAFVVIVADALRYVWAQSSSNNYAINFYNGSTWTGWKELALKSDIDSWTLYNTNGNTYPTSSAFLVVVTKSGGNYASVMCHANPSGCNIYFPTIASNCLVYFNGTGGFAASNLPSGYSVSIYTH